MAAVPFLPPQGHPSASVTPRAGKVTARAEGHAAGREGHSARGRSRRGPGRSQRGRRRSRAGGLVSPAACEVCRPHSAVSPAERCSGPTQSADRCSGPTQSAERCSGPTQSAERGSGPTLGAERRGSARRRTAHEPPPTSACYRSACSCQIFSADARQLKSPARSLPWVARVVDSSLSAKTVFIAVARRSG